MTITHRANGRAWGDGENREHYSNQLSGQVVYKKTYILIIIDYLLQKLCVEMISLEETHSFF